MRKAYVIRGAPASGKGTLSKKFVKLIEGKIAYLELDTFRWGFHTENREVKDITEDEHQFAYNNFLLMLEAYCKNGDYDLVIEGLFSWNEHGPHGNMQDIIKIIRKYRFDHRVFFLSANLETLWERNLSREYSVPREEFKQLYDYVGKHQEKKEILIDVDNKTPEEAVSDIYHNRI